jgi:hypothetical protein
MARADYFTGAQMRCIICGNPIPPERRRDAVTCSKACSRARDNYVLSRIDMEECRYCRRPATPEDKQRFAKWRKWEKEGLKAEDSVPSLLKKIQSLQKRLESLSTKAEI